MCFQLLDVVHARLFTELQDLMGPMFIDGLPHKLSMGRPYEDAADLLPAEHYERCAAASRPASSASFEPTEAASLAASTARGTGYDQDESLQAIRERYEVAYTTLRYTFPRLLGAEDTRATIVRLREAGWLDWQILVTLVNVAWNWRMKEAGIQIGVGDPSKALSLARQPETPDSPEMPLDIFSDTEVDIHAQIQAASVAQLWNLQGRTESRIEGAMRDLLTRRYQFMVDDVPHRDILDSVDENGNLIPFVEAEATAGCPPDR
jgi:hypothetical protein